MSALTYATAQILRVLPRERITRAAGVLADHRWSPPLGRAVVGLYRRAYGVSCDECNEQSGWGSFDAFFTRSLKDGVRPNDPDATAVVSPADGRIDSVGTIAEDSTFIVKGRPYRVEDLVGDGADARRYVGGTGCVIYLSPRDYHRVHSPVDGVVSCIRSMSGDYFPVNAVGIRHVPKLFVRNRRVAICIDAPPETGLGRVTVVMVAAMIVGRITVTGIAARDVPPGVHDLLPPLAVARGGEIGIFRLGSTAVVLLEPQGPARAMSHNAPAGAQSTAAPARIRQWVADEGPIQLGRALCRTVAGPTAGTNGTRRDDRRGAVG